MKSKIVLILTIIIFSSFFATSAFASTCGDGVCDGDCNALFLYQTKTFGYDEISYIIKLLAVSGDGQLIVIEVDGEVEELQEDMNSNLTDGRFASVSDIFLSTKESIPSSAKIHIGDETYVNCPADCTIINCFKQDTENGDEEQQEQDEQQDDEQEESQQELIEHLLVMDVSAPSSDVVHLTTIILNFQNEENTFIREFNKDVTIDNLDDRITIFIYYGHGLIIVGDDLSDYYENMATEISQHLEVQREIEVYPVKFSSEINNDDLRKELEANYTEIIQNYSLQIKQEIEIVIENETIIIDTKNITKTTEEIIKVKRSVTENLDEYEKEKRERGMFYSVSWFFGLENDRENLDVEFLRSQAEILNNIAQGLLGLVPQIDDAAIKIILQEHSGLLEEQAESLTIVAEEKEIRASGLWSYFGIR